MYPVTEQTLNYAPVAVGTVLVGTLVVWCLPCGWDARSWFRGEMHNLLVDDSVCAPPNVDAARLHGTCMGMYISWQAACISILGY